MSKENLQGDKAALRHNLTSTIIRSLAAVAAAALLAWALGACGAPAEQATVSGTVAYPQPAEAVPGTVLIVQIRDVSRADVPATIVAEQTIADPGSVPVAFAVPYDPAAIDESHEYAVYARVEDGEGNLRYTTTQNYAVITRGHPSENVQVTLEPVGGATPPEEATPPPSGQATVSGTVSYPQPAEAAPGTILIVQIQDLSTGGDPAIAGEQTIPGPGPVPIPFAVPYDPAAIDETHDYVVHARVEDGSGNLLYTTMQPRAVITLGHPVENLQITLEPVGGAVPQ